MGALEGRNRRFMKSPRAGLDVTNFPIHAWSEGGEFFFRATMADPQTKKSFGPWWFSNNGEGRFDLSGSRGTLYGGHDEQSAIFEKLGPRRDEYPISHTNLKEYYVWRLPVDRSTRLASMCDVRSQSYGITNEIGDMTPYDIPQDWAEYFDNRGFHGIRFKSRFDTRVVCHGIALFGDAGARNWAADFICRLDDQRIVEMLEDAGYFVPLPPTLAELTVL